METPFQTTSFIPKKPITQNSTQRTKGTNLFSLIGSILLVIVIILSVFVYFWSTKLKTEVVQLKQQVDLAQERFDPTTLENLKRLDKQIITAEKILNNHITISPVLVNVLNANTLKKVQYTQLTYRVEGVGSTAKIKTKLSGKAESLPYVALQSKKLAENRYIQNPIFSDIITGKDNTVSFNLYFDVSPNLVLYNEVVLANELADTMSTSTATNESF